MNSWYCVHVQVHVHVCQDVDPLYLLANHFHHLVKFTDYQHCLSCLQYAKHGERQYDDQERNTEKVKEGERSEKKLEREREREREREMPATNPSPMVDSLQMLHHLLSPLPQFQRPTQQPSHTRHVLVHLRTRGCVS